MSRQPIICALFSAGAHGQPPDPTPPPPGPPPPSSTPLLFFVLTCASSVAPLHGQGRHRHPDRAGCAPGQGQRPGVTVAAGLERAGAAGALDLESRTGPLPLQWPLTWTCRVGAGAVTGMRPALAGQAPGFRSGRRNKHIVPPHPRRRSPAFMPFWN